MNEYVRFDGATPTERLALASAALALAFDPTMAAADVLALAHRALGDGALLAEHTADAPSYGACKWVTLLCEDLDTFERESERGLADARARGSAYGFALLQTDYAQATLYRGELAASVAHSEAGIAGARDIRRTPATTRFFDSAPAVLLPLALVPMGDRQRARDVVATASTLGDLHTAELCMVLFGRAVVELADGDAAAALRDFLAYGDVVARVGYEERGFAWRSGAALAAHALADNATAMSLADEGVAIARTWAAPRGLGRAIEELNILGARPRRPRISGVDALTGSERRVAAMAADRMTNREIAQALFVTQETIENHLANAYRKLDIASRHELPAKLGQTSR